ncbi:hypothetical protein GCM10011611_31170 [Aliidongia dinghuensis]|uniref:Uncharacterized protein n=1 Tax=Aliidongia dinghuensis TaxID=1867774 RepID=A0A8J2YV49_9PROT|nr:hypothetical protein [Aliidongia dinghuensis]GGF22864.1 hypothetical protein GCM10011611_31170 [Aliidongia dinghuensis]
MHTEFLVANCGLTLSEFSAIDRLDGQMYQELAARDLWATFSADFYALKLFNASARDMGYGELVPIYDPMVEHIDQTNGLWLALRDRAGEPVGAMACRLREVTTDLARAFADCSFLMGPMPPAGARCSVDAVDLGQLRGPLVFAGALWVRPERQGAFLSKLLFQAIVRMAFARWKPTALVSLVAERDINMSMRIYGFRRVNGLVRFTDPRWKGLPRYALLSLDQHEIRERLLGLGALPVVPTGSGREDRIVRTEPAPEPIAAE